MSVKFITDSTSYLPKELIDKYGIKVISLNILVNNQNYREESITNEEFYKLMDSAKEIPKSSQPSVEETVKAMEEFAAEGHDIVCVYISSKMSGTFSSAHIAKEMVLEKYPDAEIEIIDSETNCMQMGFEVLEGVKKAEEGASIEEVIERINYVKANSRFLFVPHTLKYLRMGGRIGTASALIGNILKICPILTVENGITTVFEKVRTKKKAVDTIVEKIRKDSKEKPIEGIIVHHINCEEEGRELAERLRNEFGMEVKIQSIGPVIGSHVGPGAIGAAYFMK